MQRRKFFRSLALGGLSAALAPVGKAVAPVAETVLPTAADANIPDTNIGEALAIPRTACSMPGKYPGKVVRVNHPDCVVDGKPSEARVYEMLKKTICSLAGENDPAKAWLQFVGPQDTIGLKVNPIAGKLLSTSHALVRSVIRQLEEAGIAREHLLIWDRREEDLHNAGFTAENYPGIRILGTEYHDENGSYVNAEGKFYGEERVDKSPYFYVDLEGEYDAYTMPYMLNGGKYSYYTKICTQMVTKIINLPVLKNAGTSITACMKNLAFGSLTNTARLHGPLWHTTCAYACAFPPLRDKAVLHIIDGMIGCFDGGPEANPQFICRYDALVAGTDPVAVDRIAYDMVVARRIEEGIQKTEKPAGRKFLELAETIGLGIADTARIELTDINLTV